MDAAERRAERESNAVRGRRADAEASAMDPCAPRSEMDFAARLEEQGNAGGKSWLFALLLRAGRTIFENVEHAVSAQGESMLMFRPLAIVIRFGPQTQQDIARLTAQHPAGVSRIVDELEERGLVRRVRGEHDRRTIRVEPTDEGRAVFARVDPYATGALEAAMAGLDEHELLTFRSLLEKIVSSGAP